MKLTLFKRILSSKPIKGKYSDNNNFENEEENNSRINTTTTSTKDNINLDENKENEKVDNDEEVFIETKGDVIISSPPFKLNTLKPIDRLVDRIVV